MSMKNVYDTIGNRTRDLPVCSAGPQPTVPLRAPKKYGVRGRYRGEKKMHFEFSWET